MNDNNKTREELIADIQKLTRQLDDARHRIRELEQSGDNNFFLDILSAIPDVITLTDANGIIRFTSRKAKEMFGEDNIEEFIGHSILEYIDPSGHEKAVSELGKLNSGNLTGIGEYLGIHKSGKNFEIEVNGEFLSGDSGKPFQMVFVTRDITKRKQAEAELRESEEKYRTIFETIRDVYYEVDLEGIILEISPSITNMSRGLINREDIIGKSLVNLYADPEARSLFLKSLAKTGYVADYEIDILNRDGTVNPVAVTAQFIFDRHGDAVKIAGTMRDVSERRAIMNELMKFRTIASKANYGISIASLEGILLYSNEYFASMHGYTIDEIQGHHLSMFHNSNQMADVLKAIKIIQETGVYHGQEVWRTRKDGSVFASLMNVVLMYENGVPQYLAATVIDITEIKEKEKQIRELNVNLEQKVRERTAELENFFSVALDLLSISDTKGHFLKVNKAWEIMLGYSSSDLENRVYFDFIHPDDLISTQETIKKLENQEVVIDFINRFRTKSGTYRYIEWHSVPVGNLVYAAARDVTDQILRVEELRQARLLADKASMAKSEFMSRMSHELRTPMNSILGFAQLLNINELNSFQKNAVNHILKSGKLLLTLINDVLDLSNIEAGKVTFLSEVVQVPGLIREIIENIHPLALSNNISIELFTDSDRDYSVKADRQRLKQILLNLVNNAVIYNKAGGFVNIFLDKSPETSTGKEMLRIAVKDSGIGILPDDLPKIFVPFEKINTNGNFEEGMGLALSVAKNMTTLMNGSIGVESVYGEGSTFWVDFPMAEERLKNNPATGNAVISNPHVKSQRCIIYVEDNRPNVELVVTIVEKTRPGIKVMNTSYGRQALDMAVQVQPDLILLDLNLPDMHGSEVLKILKEDERTKAIPVIVITADAMKYPFDKLMSNGADFFLVKPLNIPEFLKIIDSYFK